MSADYEEVGEIKGSPNQMLVLAETVACLDLSLEDSFEKFSHDCSEAVIKHHVGNVLVVSY